MRIIFGRTDIELLVKGDLDVGHAAMLHHGSHRVHGDGVRGCQADFLHVRLEDSLGIDWSRPSFHLFFYLNLLDCLIREIIFRAKSFKHLNF